MRKIIVFSLILMNVIAFNNTAYAGIRIERTPVSGTYDGKTAEGNRICIATDKVCYWIDTEVKVDNGQTTGSGTVLCKHLLIPDSGEAFTEIEEGGKGAEFDPIKGWLLYFNFKLTANSKVFNSESDYMKWLELRK